MNWIEIEWRMVEAVFRSKLDVNVAQSKFYATGLSFNENQL